MGSGLFPKVTCTPPRRKCNGIAGDRVEDCRSPATIICTGERHVQWFACDKPEHRQHAISTEPLASWWARILGD